MNSFLVTTRIQGSKGTNSKSQLWDSEAPLALGHPFRWVMEKTDTGIRIRELATNQVFLQEIPHSNLRGTGAVTVNLPRSGKNDLSLEIKALRALKTPFATSPKNSRTSTHPSDLTVYHCAGNWVAASASLRDTFVARVGDSELFKICKNGAQFEIHASTAILLQGATKNELPQGQTLCLNASDLTQTVVRLKGSKQCWRFCEAVTPGFSDVATSDPTPDTIWFRKALRATAIALGAFAFMTAFWPKPDTSQEPLVPPQFTKIVMMPKAKPAASVAATTENTLTKDVPKKVENSAVVQAFRAKALQSAVSGLLKGGMTKLLQQSDFVAGTAHSANARQIFDSKNVALIATGANTGVSNDKNIKIASIGGASAKGGVGYGKGENAGVNGQGHSFVSMDVADSTVEEGLTKDEVGEVIHRHLSEVRYCYESAMLRTPDIEGKLMVDFVIGGNGIVKSSEVKSSTLPDPRLDDCILRRLGTWKFPLPKGGVDVAVSYPFIFKTLGR